jgi:hypothetical protein
MELSRLNRLETSFLIIFCSSCRLRKGRAERCEPVVIVGAASEARLRAREAFLLPRHTTVPT